MLGGASETGRTGGAAEAPDRDPPRVLGEAETEDQLRVQGWRRDACRRDEEDRAYILRVRAAPVQRSLSRLLREVEGVLDIQGVLLGKGVVLLETLHGHAEVAVLDVDVVEDGDQTLEVPVRLGEHAPREPLGLALPHAVGRQGGRDREDSGRELAQLVADPVSRATSGSGCSHVLRKTYWETRLR